MENDRNLGTGPGSTTGGTTGAGLGGTTGSGYTRTGGADDLDTRAGSYDRSFADEEHGMKERVNEKIEEGREMLSDRVDEGRERVGHAVESGRYKVADQLERAGDRLEGRARAMEDAGGVQRRAGQVAHRASGALDTSADYLRNHDMGEMRDDLERTIRERPLLSVGVAVGAGYLLARILRD